MLEQIVRLSVWTRYPVGGSRNQRRMHQKIEAHCQSKLYHRNRIDGIVALNQGVWSEESLDVDLPS